MSGTVTVRSRLRVEARDERDALIPRAFVSKPNSFGVTYSKDETVTRSSVPGNGTWTLALDQIRSLTGATTWEVSLSGEDFATVETRIEWWFIEATDEYTLFFENGAGGGLEAAGHVMGMPATVTMSCWEVGDFERLRIAVGGPGAPVTVHVMAAGRIET